MKILVYNYSNPYFTEAIYLNTAFNAAGCQSTLWPNNISTFDIFDMTKPDIYITHHQCLSLDLVLYLQQAKNIELVINITGLNQEQLSELEQKLDQYNIKAKLFFANYYDHNLKSKYSTVMTLLHGADIFFGKSKKQYDIEYAIIVDDKSQLKSIGSTYHFLSNNEKLANDVDICMPSHKIAQVWGNYNNVVFRYFNGIIPQSFYDAGYYNNNVFFDIDNKHILDNTLSKMFGEGTHCDINIRESGNILDKIKKKHTCLHRAKSLLSQFSCKDQTDKIQLIIEEAVK